MPIGGDEAHELFNRVITQLVEKSMRDVPYPGSISDAEVRAAKAYLDNASQLAGKPQPVPETIVRGMLEASAAARAWEVHPARRTP